MAQPLFRATGTRFGFIIVMSALGLKVRVDSLACVFCCLHAMDVSDSSLSVQLRLLVGQHGSGFPFPLILLSWGQLWDRAIGVCSPNSSNSLEVGIVKVHLHSAQAIYFFDICCYSSSTLNETLYEPIWKHGHFCFHSNINNSLACIRTCLDRT